MSSTSPSNGDRFVDLLIQRSTTGLSESEQQEFENLSHSPKHESEVERYDLTVTALDLAFGFRDRESMPRDIQDRLLLAAGRFFGNGSKGASTATSADAQLELAQRRAANRFSWRKAVALAVTAATAACVMLMLSGYNPFAKTPIERMQGFANLKPADLVKVSWQPVHEPLVGGEALWSDSRQEGYMKFTDMPINDPSVKQYQLWIFDTNKEHLTPVDGGVFDISAAGEVVIPINAHVPVEKAVRFAVTVEKPGGVTVSKRERIPVQAFVD